jgi:hypothetical protein
VAADVVAAVLFGVAVIVFSLGGGAISIGDLRLLSIRTPVRPFLLAMAVTAVRYWFVRQPPVVVSRLLRPRPPLPLEELQLFGPRGASAWERAGEFLLVTAGCAVFVAIATWPQVAQPYAVSDIGDPLFSIWRLMWVTHEFARDPLNLFNANQLYPEPRTLTFSDPVIAPSVLFGVLTAAGLHRVAAYNVVLLSGGVFSGVSMFYLVRALTGRRDAAWVSGAIFAMYPYRIEHFSHLELQMTMWMPLVLWCLHRVLASGALRDGLATGAAFAAQMLSALYYGAFLMPYLACLGTLTWLARGCPRAPLRALAWGALVAVLLLAPVGAAYLQTRPYMGKRPIGQVHFYSAVGPDYLKAHYRSLTYGWLDRDSKPERSLFPRIAPVALTAIALWPPLSATRVAYAVTLAVAVETSFGINGRFYGPLYEYVPPFGGMRGAARFSVMVGMTLAILSGYGAARLFKRWPAWRGALLPVMLGVVILEGLPRLSLVRPWLEPPNIYASFTSNRPASVLAEFPMPENGAEALAEFNYLYFSTFHWQKLVNGQSGWMPPRYEEMLKAQRDFPSDAAIADLRQRGVEYIAVHGAFYKEPESFSRTVTGLDARTDVELMTKAPWEGSESRLYRLYPVATVPSIPSLPR